MLKRYFITTLAILFSVSALSFRADAQRRNADAFAQFIEEVRGDLLATPDDAFTAPDEVSLRDFENALMFFRSGAPDSCKEILRRYDYSLEKIFDGKTGIAYDVIRERHPSHRGWGTYIYNGLFSKRVVVEVNHPVDDANALSIGVDMFRATRSAWLLIAGTSKRVAADKFSSDIARTTQSVFQRVHASLIDPSYVALSLHSYTKRYYTEPVMSTDVVLSNGTTSDEQWGISQLSLALRDSLRTSNFACALAMYDSGYGALSANTNTQGVVSNERVGFGRWINVELSEAIRENPVVVSKFIQAVDRALELVGKKSLVQANRIFGLVSPRVVRIDSAHPILFPAPGQQSYRIISFNESKAKNDTVNLHVGSWMNVFNSDGSMARIQALDSTGGILHEFRQTRSKSSRNVLASIVEHSDELPIQSDNSNSTGRGDSSLANGREPDGFEPIQVHRIPLHPMVLTSAKEQGEIVTTSYRWEGVIQSGFSTSVPTFHISDHREIVKESDILPSFLIPIMSNSYRSAGSAFVGVQMTKVLVEEIARLVTEQDNQGLDVSLLAEEDADGDYYLRVIPTSQVGELADLKK